MGEAYGQGEPPSCTRGGGVCVCMYLCLYVCVVVWVKHMGKENLAPALDAVLPVCVLYGA